MCANTPKWGQLARHWFVNPGDDMGHQVGVDPTENARANVCHFGHKGWLSRSDADRAARVYVDVIYERNDSY